MDNQNFEHQWQPYTGQQYNSDMGSKPVKQKVKKKKSPMPFGKF